MTTESEIQKLLARLSEIKFSERLDCLFQWIGLTYDSMQINTKEVIVNPGEQQWTVRRFVASMKINGYLFESSPTAHPATAIASLLYRIEHWYCLLDCEQRGNFLVEESFHSSPNIKFLENATYTLKMQNMLLIFGFLKKDLV